ncbi:MAG: sodium/solute symporter, partial [Candidatus Omnitrophica bacterium]|nr:sodium/solute symporter [Candidatus Omnitrophota bacterium]
MEVSFGTLNTIILLVYLGLMVLIGALFAGKQKTTKDFFLAGQSMNWVLVAISIFASITSAVTYMGIPGLVYKENIAFMFGILMMPVAAPFIIWLFLPVYKKYNVTTSYEYVYHRFGQPARYTVSALFLLARLGWLGTVVYAPALALSVVTGIDLALTILFMGVMGTLYTALGGLAAVIWTDVVQFIILVGGGIWVAATLAFDVPGGVTEIFRVTREAGHLDIIDWAPSLTEMTLFVVMISYFIQFLHDYGVDQVTVQRLMATPTLGGMARATLVNSFISVFVVGLLAFIGLGLYAYVNVGDHPFPEGLNRDEIFPYYIIHALPQGISGLVITGVFAAAMSSVDSGINSLSTIVVNDFVKPLRGKEMDEGSDVLLARILVVLFGGFAVGV